jgi:hypothetical protein
MLRKMGTFDAIFFGEQEGERLGISRAQARAVPPADQQFSKIR